MNLIEWETGCYTTTWGRCRFAGVGVVLGHAQERLKVPVGRRVGVGRSSDGI